MNDLSVLNKEDLAFLKDLAKEITTQDTRGTAKPYGLVIGKKERQITDFDNCENYAIYWNECDYDTFEEFIEAIEEWYLEDREAHPTIDYIKENCEDISDLRNYEYIINSKHLSEPMRVYGYNIVETFDPNHHCLGNFFLTDKGAKNYIKANKHNLGSTAFTYGIHLYRNPEMKRLFEILEKFADIEV